MMKPGSNDKTGSDGESDSSEESVSTGETSDDGEASIRNDETSDIVRLIARMILVIHQVHLVNRTLTVVALADMYWLVRAMP
jgi:hypothetical protein